MSLKMGSAFEKAKHEIHVTQQIVNTINYFIVHIIQTHNL